MHGCTNEEGYGHAYRVRIGQFAMSARVSLRCDHDASSIRGLAKKFNDPRQIRRLLALAAIYDDKIRAEAPTIGCMNRQTLRDRVHRFNEEGPEGLTNRKGAGSTVEKYRARPRKPPSPTWKAFLDNHLKELVSIDFFVVPRLRFRCCSCSPVIGVGSMSFRMSAGCSGTMNVVQAEYLRTRF
jgi:hypothetical protein